MAVGQLDSFANPVYLHKARLNTITEAQCVQHVTDELAAGRGGWILALNLHRLRLYAYDPSYAALCAKASLVVADGMPLVWASRLQSTPLPERVAGSNLIWSLSAAAAAHGRSIFLVGGDEGAAAGAARILQRQHPALRVAGTLSPPRGYETREGEAAAVMDAVVQAQPDIVYVGLGVRKEEQMMESLRQCLPGAWALGVGVSFSFVSGQIPRAPMWMQRSGFEWLHRLGQEPYRLARRYLVQGVPFALRLFGNAVVRRFSGHNGSTPG